MTLRVRFAETDQMGVAHHGAYVVWMEVARVEWMRTLGLSYAALEASGVSMAVSRIDVRYRHAAHFDDLVRIDCAMTRLRSRYARFEYDIRLEDDTPVASALSEHVPTDRRGRAVRLPVAWSDALAPHAAEGPRDAP
ncbi:MAG: thioesterase family protein [Trueperaceae bacterium]|nr:thioesterase family protein [Trueperaceae bacterium]